MSATVPPATSTDAEPMADPVTGPIVYAVRLIMPHHLRTLAGVDGEITLQVQAPVTNRSVLNALEQRFPMLRGTVRDHVTAKRRPKVRFYANEQDLTHQDPDTPLPEVITTGSKPFMIVGAISGG